MDLNQLVSNLIVDSKGTAVGGLTAIKADSSLGAFVPELVICATIVLLLLVRVFNATERLDAALHRLTGLTLTFLIALAGSAAALIAANPLTHLKRPDEVVADVVTRYDVVEPDGMLSAAELEVIPEPERPLQNALRSADKNGDGLVSVGELADARDDLIAAHESLPTTATRMEIFTGMLVYDTFTVFMRAMLLLFLVLFIIFTRMTGIPDREDGADIYSLMLGATLGMCLMASANHLLMIFMAVEMASVPSYVLAGMVKGRKRAGEAALKYSVYGAGAAGVMLYGISLLAGVLNSAHLPTMAARLGEMLPELMQGDTGTLMVLSVGGLMLMAGLAFKLSAVPFHFWCPDVFEGATAEVDAFLSVASKAAALALLVRVAVGLGAVAPPQQPPGARTALAAATAGQEPGETASSEPSPSDQAIRDRSLDEALTVALYNVADQRQPPRERLDSQPPAAGPDAAPAAEPDEAPAAEPDEAPAAEPDTAPAVEPEAAAGESGAAAPEAGEALAAREPSRGELMQGLGPARSFIGKLIALLAVVTCTFGNLAAYGQTNIKRLLAYSTIAHAGYMMMAVPPIVAMAHLDTAGAERAAAALVLYICVYLFMNLGAFAVVAFLRNSMNSEEIEDYGGLLRQCPWLVICFSLILFSLVGLPPLAGFIGKFAVFGALADGYRVSGHTYLIVLLVIGGINTAISLYYYLRVVKVMTMSPEPESRLPFQVPFLPTFFVGLLTLPTALLIIGWDQLNELALAAAQYLLS